MTPFRAAGGFEETVGKLRVVEQAFDHELGLHEARRAQARDEREHNRQLEEQWAGERKRRAGEDAGA